MTKVKICGLMTQEDIACVNDCMPEYAGFVFAPSRRQVTEPLAKELRMDLNPGIQAVGVFVNEEKENIAKLCEEGIINVVQLHGDEDEAYIRELKSLIKAPVIKALRVRSKEQAIQANDLPCDYLLLDTYTKGQYGGSGETFDLGLIPPMKKPFFLAGGLTQHNVRERIISCSPYAVDVSSGVEGERGQKERVKIQEFIEKVREV